KLQRLAEEKSYTYDRTEMEAEEISFTVNDLKSQVAYYENEMRSYSQYQSEYWEAKLNLLKAQKDLEIAEFNAKYYGEPKDAENREVDLPEVREKKANDKLEVNYGIAAKYYSLFLTQANRNSLTYSRDYLEKIRDITEVKLGQGTAIQIDLDTANRNLTEVVNSITQADNDIIVAEWQVLYEINQYNVDEYNFILKAPEIPERISITEEKLKREFFENNHEYLLNVKKEELEKEYLEDLKEIYGTDSPSYKKAENDYERLKMENATYEAECKLSLKTLLYDIHSAYEKFSLLDETTKANKARITAMKESYRLGKISVSDYMKFLADCKNTEYEYNSALCNLELLTLRIELAEKGRLITD
ncbi:MAG: TolC family protein, partial [Ruminococcus sp.]|nr:TolC family protein [Ruminococcus sp.]